MNKETIECIDNAIQLLCKEFRGTSTDEMIALAEALGMILLARAMLKEN